ncbi:MAG: hypothetical protein ACXW31_13550 [Thermoanaerobaculia bacterium]
MNKRGRNLFKDKEHLVRMAGIFALGIIAFLVLQLLLVPDTFGLYGHYRAAAIDDEMRKPITYAGRASCARCHAAVVDVQKAGKHATLGCEGCHGPLLKHVGAPSREKPLKLSTTKVCPVCHEANIARPKGHKQVNSAEHSGGEPCDTCHSVHAPEMGEGS